MKNINILLIDIILGLIDISNPSMKYIKVTSKSFQQFFFSFAELNDIFYISPFLIALGWSYSC